MTQCACCAKTSERIFNPSLQPRCCPLVPPTKTLDPPVSQPPLQPPSCLPSVIQLPGNQPSHSANLTPSRSLKLQCQNYPLRSLEANKSPSSGLGNVHLSPLLTRTTAPPSACSRKLAGWLQVPSASSSPLPLSLAVTGAVSRLEGLA